MARIRHSELMLELVDICVDISSDMRQHLSYYRASAYKLDAARQINSRIDQLRAIFQIIGDEDLNEAMLDHDSILDQGAQLLAAGECTLSARVHILLAQMTPALASLTRRNRQDQAPLREDTLRVLQRHRRTLEALCPEGSRSREILKGI